MDSGMGSTAIEDVPSAGLGGLVVRLKISTFGGLTVAFRT